MKREASLEEGPVLRLIWDYFEQAGLVECLLAVENCCKDYGQVDLPLELSALREMALTGRWDQVIQYLSVLGNIKDKEGLQRCMYAAQRQKYFEILEHVADNIRSKFRLGFTVSASGEMLSPSEAKRTHELIEHQLATLEPLCPSPMKYQSLKDLISLPSISSSKEFSTWDLHSGRLKAFYEIGEWVSKVLHLSVKFPMLRRDIVENEENEALCALLKLVAKGLLYEQCEHLCRARSEESEREQLAPSMLDLSSWIQQQPDSSFQLPPTEIRLVVRPLSKSTSSEAQISNSIDMGRDKNVLNDNLDRSVHSLSAGDREEKIIATGGACSQKDGSVSFSFEVAAGITIEDVDNRKSAIDKINEMSWRGEGGAMSEEELKPPMTYGESLYKSVQQPSPRMVTEVMLPASSQESCGTSEVQVKPRTCHLGGDEKQQVSSMPPPPPPPPSSPNIRQPTLFSMASEVAHLPCITPTRRDSSTPKDCKAFCSSVKTSPPSSPILFSLPVVPKPSHGHAHTSTTTHSPANILTALSGPSHMPIPAPISYMLSAAPGPVHTSTNSQGIPCVSAAVDGLAAMSTTTRGRSHISKAATLSFSHNRLSTAAPGPVCLGTALPGRTPTTPAMLEGGYRVRNQMELTSKNLCWPSVSLLGTVSDSQVVRSVAFSGSGKVVAIGANSRTLRLCYTAALLEKKNSEAVDTFYRHPKYHKSSIYCMAWLNDTVLASGSNDQTIRLLTCSPDHKFKVQKPLILHKGTVRDLAFTKEGLLVSGGGGSLHVKVTDLNTRQTVLSLAGHTDQILALGVLPGGLVVSGGQDNKVLIWDMRTHLPTTSISLGSSVTSLTVCREGLVTAHLDGSCSVHELKSYQCTASYMPHSGECRTVRFCPDKAKTSWVLSGSYDGTVCLAEVAAAAERVQWTKLCQHKDKVIQCRWHPEGHLFASTGADRKACFWRIH